MTRRRDDDYTDVADAISALRRDDDAVRRERRRDAVVARCLPLADHVAQRFAGRGEPLDDLVQVARIGLVNAVDRFDAARGSDFVAYAVPTIMGEVRRHFRDSTWAVKVPRHAKESSVVVNRAVDELVQRLGRAPRPSEVAAHLGMPVDDVIDGLFARSAYTASSIDAEADTGSRSLAETLGENDDRIGRVDEFADLAPALSRLPARDRHILTLRFFRSMSQSEIAAEVGISQMHVSRLLARALRTLRDDLT